jgi:hypothetical protein
MRFPAIGTSPRPSAPLRTAILAVAILSLLSARSTGVAVRQHQTHPSLSVHGLWHQFPADRSVGASFRR